MANGHSVSERFVQTVVQDHERIVQTPRDLGNLAEPFPVQSMANFPRLARTVAPGESVYPVWPANKFLIAIEHHKFEEPTLTGNVEAIPDIPIVSTNNFKVAQTYSGIYLPEDSRVIVQYVSNRWYIIQSQTRFKATADADIDEAQSGTVTLVESGAKVTAHLTVNDTNAYIFKDDEFLIEWFADAQKFIIEPPPRAGSVADTTTVISAATSSGPGSGTADLLYRDRDDDEWEVYKSGVTVWNSCEVAVPSGFRVQLKQVRDGDLYVDVECCDDTGGGS